MVCASVSGVREFGVRECRRECGRECGDVSVSVNVRMRV